MTVQDKIDTKFLKDTVADVVVRACSECAVARPEDPVGFVAGWLDKFVQNDAILKKRAVELTEQAAVEAAETEVRDPEKRARVVTRNRAFSKRALTSNVCESRQARPVVPFAAHRPDSGSSPVRVLALPRTNLSSLSPLVFFHTS
jgi:hypothetical protein